MRENRTSGSVRGAPGNRRSYRESGLTPRVQAWGIGAGLSFEVVFVYWILEQGNIGEF